MVIGNGGATYIDCKNESFDFSMEDEEKLQEELKDIIICTTNSDKEIKINNFYFSVRKDGVKRNYFVPSMTIHQFKKTTSNSGDNINEDYLYTGLGFCGRVNDVEVYPVRITIDMEKVENAYHEVQDAKIIMFYIDNMIMEESILSFESQL